LINLTEECQFDVFIQAQKEKEKYRVMRIEEKISSDEYLIKQDMYV